MVIGINIDRAKTFDTSQYIIYTKNGNRYTISRSNTLGGAPNLADRSLLADSGLAFIPIGHGTPSSRINESLDLSVF